MKNQQFHNSEKDGRIILWKVWFSEQCKVLPKLSAEQKYDFETAAVSVSRFY